MLGLGLLTDNLDVKLFDFDFIYFLDIDQEPILKSLLRSDIFNLTVKFKAGSIEPIHPNLTVQGVRVDLGRNECHH